MNYVKVRVCEWTALLPAIQDNNSQLSMANGHTYVEMDDVEKLTEVECIPTGKTTHIPMKDADDKPVNVPHTLYAFRATLVQEVSEEEVLAHVEVEPEADKGHHVVLPGQSNRAERRGKKR